MLKYIVKRLLLLIPVLFGVSLIVFFLMRVCAPDPAPIVLGQHATQESMDAWREANGLNDPVVTQYVDFIKGAFTGDLGTSYYTKTPVVDEIMSRFPATVELAIVAIILASVLGIAVGVVSAVHKNSIFDNGGMLLSLVGVSIPIFWLGIMLIILFSGTLHWLPSTGRVNPALRPDTVTGFMIIDSILAGDMEALKDVLQHLVLPAVTLSLYSMAIIARMTRSSMLETLNQDYIRTARAKGLPEWKVLGKHVMRNAILPVVTYIGPMFAALITGSFVVEKVFGIPGIGNLFTNSILNRDYTLIMGITVFFAVILVICILVVDILYVLIDPRIKYQ